MALDRTAPPQVEDIHGSSSESGRSVASAAHSIDLVGISKTFGGHAVLKTVSLSIEPGELMALLGPSGSGKTTLLRIIAGLETPDEGALRFGGDDATGLSVQDRRAGFVFQSYALFRHMTVFDNIAYGLSVRPRRSRPKRSEIARRVNELLDMVQLPGHGARYPAQLSGGQRQRIALARALAIEPRVLLLDEPFGALDAKVRKDLRQWLREIHDRTALTTVFVTHDQNEAMELADRVAILNDGRIEQLGAASEIRQRPATAFIRDFLS
jgi:sulfate/thiosulfate transport system ATP-binding protein